MYLRHAIRRKGGKEYTYWQLVRSVRRGGKLAQEVVAQLGELDAQGRVRARELAARITGGAMQGQLFEPLPQSNRLCDASNLWQIVMREATPLTGTFDTRGGPREILHFVQDDGKGSHDGWFGASNVETPGSAR